MPSPSPPPPPRSGGKAPEDDASPYAPPRAEVDGADDRAGPPGFWDRQFGDTSTVVLILFGFCCACPALLFSIGGLVGCKEEEARHKARLLLFFSLVWMVVSTILNVLVRWQELQP